MGKKVCKVISAALDLATVSLRSAAIEERQFYNMNREVSRALPFVGIAYLQ
jgi:hypothetical protein